MEMKAPPELQEIIDSIPARHLLRVDEVAEFFQITKRTVYNWYENDKLKGMNLNGVLRIYRHSVIAVIISHTGKKAGIETEAEVEQKIKQTSPAKRPVRTGGWVSGWK